MKKSERRQAFVASLPVLFGYVFLGIAFGVTLSQAGYGPAWALACSGFVYAGSLEFVMVPLLAGGADLLTVALTAFMVNARHIFYGISFIERFRTMKGLYPYMVFSLTDETYSVFCSLPGDAPDGVLFRVSLYDQCYWVLGSLLGALLAVGLPVDLTGIDFSMTALFIVIVVEKAMAAENRVPLLLGGAVSLTALFLLGPSSFLAPALLVTALVLAGMNIVKKGEQAA